MGVFKTIIIPNGVYACNTWNLRARDIDRLEKTYMFLLRKTIGITAKLYEDRGTEYIFTVAKQRGVVIHSLECYIELYQLRYLLWKLQRLGEEKLCGMIMHGRIAPGTRGRKRGRPAKTYRHCLTEALEHFDVTYQEMVTSTWTTWLAKIHGPGIDRAMDRVEFLADAHFHTDSTSNSQLGTNITNITNNDGPEAHEASAVTEAQDSAHNPVLEEFDQRTVDRLYNKHIRATNDQQEIANENEAIYIFFWENLDEEIRNPVQTNVNPQIVPPKDDENFFEEGQTLNGPIVNEKDKNDGTSFNDVPNNALPNGNDEPRPTRQERRRLRGHLMAARKRQRCEDAVNGLVEEGTAENTVLPRNQSELQK